MRDYTNSVARELNEMGLEVIVREVEKANKVKFEGLEIQTGTSVKPLVYTESFEEHGDTPKEAAMKIKEMYEREYKQVAANVDVDFYTDYEKVKDKLMLRLYNQETNAEISRSAKRYGFDDLILVPVVEMEMPEGQAGSIKVKEEHLKKWGIDKNTLFRDAMENTKKQKVNIRSMSSFVSEIIGWDDEMAASRLSDILIVSNEKTIFGASAILGALKGLKKSLEFGFFIIPSSVHEVLVIPKMPGMTSDFVDKMIVEVNQTAVAPEEVLGNHSYAF